LKASGKKVVYVCDPRSQDRFLVCTNATINCQPCSKGMKWNQEEQACASVQKCLPVPSQCQAPDVSVPTTPSTPATTTPVAATTPATTPSTTPATTLVVTTPAATTPAATTPATPEPLPTSCKDCYITPLQRCVCAEVMKITGKTAAHICDPFEKSKYLACSGKSVTCMSCPRGLSWNRERQACDVVRKCLPLIDRCLPTKPTTTTTTTTTTIRPVPKPTEGCIDCDITARQRCVCSAILKASGSTHAYVCDPESLDKYLECSGTSVSCQSCTKGMFWNYDIGACVLERKCRPVSNSCDPSGVPAPQAVITPLQRCVCAAALVSSGLQVAYSCDPASSNGYLECSGLQVSRVSCSHGLKWNSDINACIPFPKCDPIPLECQGSAKPVPATSPPAKGACRVDYKLHAEKMDWYSASRICEANRGTLATIPDFKTQIDLTRRYGACPGGKMWIGGSDRLNEADWRWVSGELIGFSFWHNGEPSGRKHEDCLQMNMKKYGLWSDEVCDVLLPFLCQTKVCA